MSSAPDADSPVGKNVIAKIIDFFRSCFSGGDAKADPFRQQVLKDVAEVMAQRIKSAPAEIQTALKELADHGKDSPILEALRRVDCEIVKQSPTHAECTVAIALILDGKMLLQKVVQDVPWENLPQPVRADFIRSGQKTQSFVVIERQVEPIPPPQEKRP